MAAKEKLKEAKRLYEIANADQRYVLESLFPELKESEDERIRKEIVSAINIYCSEYHRGTKVRNDMLAWIEKQGEQKQDVNMQINPSEYINDMGGNGCYLKNAAQKPAWSEDDDNCLSTIIAEFSKCSGKSVSKDEWFRCNDFLNSLKDRVQPKLEWSKEDKEMLDKLIADYKFLSKEFCDKENNFFIGMSLVEEDLDMINWLNSLEYRVQPQPKQKWSEEDERCLINAIDACKQMSNEDYDYSQSYIDAINWFISLKDRYTWKPSDEQMEALIYVVNLMASSESPTENDYYYNVFKDLIKQLKKLMKE